jgi:hypothetical protein
MVAGSLPLLMPSMILMALIKDPLVSMLASEVMLKVACQVISAAWLLKKTPQKNKNELTE